MNWKTLNTAKRRFALPTAERSEVSPRQIVHGCDYHVEENGELEYHYNFLDYTWDIDGAEVRTRHYLDEGSRVNVMMPIAELDQPKYGGILTYLQRRYRVLKTLEGEGYAVGWASVSENG